MKRSPMPARTKPMPRGGTRLKRSTIRRRADKPKLAPVKRRNYSAVPPAVKAAVAERSGGRCEVAGLKYDDRCERQAVHLHHRRMRSQGGKNTVDNLAHVCALCHFEIHANPADSYRLGLLRRRAA